jgi:hypothetical protein
VCDIEVPRWVVLIFCDHIPCVVIR